MMMSFGLISLLGLFVSGGLFLGSGLPLGLPPLENDPVIAHVAPDDCLMYVAWNGTAVPSAESSNLTERLLADPDVRRFATEITDRLLKSIRKNAGGGENTRVVAAELPRLLHAFAVNPTAIYVGTPNPMPSVGIVCRVGERTTELEESLRKIEAAIADEPGEVIKRNGYRVHHWPVAPSAPPLEWGVIDDCIVIGFGPEEFEKIAARKRAEKTAAWLTQIQNRLPIERVANIVHINTGAILANAAPMLQNDPTSLKVLEALGLNDIRSLTCVTGLDKTECVSRTWLNTTGQNKGLLKLFDVKPLTADELKVVPADARVAVAFRMDSAMVFREIKRIADAIEPGTSEEMTASLGFLESALGLSIEDDVLQSVGDSWRIYQSKAEGGSLFTGWTAVVSVRNSEKLGEVMHVLQGFFAAQNARLSPRSRHVRVQSAKSGDHKIFFLNFVGETFPFAPAWCVTDDELVLSVFPQGVKAYLNRETTTPLVTQLPKFSTGFPSNAVGLVHYDAEEIFSSVYPLLQIGANLLAAELQRDGIDVDISLLPSPTAIGRYLKPAGVTVHTVDDGIEIVSRRTIPMGIESAGMFMSSILFGSRSFRSSSSAGTALSHILSPTRARRDQSINNMKQIMLAFHNFHDVHSRFPAAVTKDKNGKPGLSWRVHLLPFMDQAPLFNAFRLDEPWDSEHNRKLIKLMPQVYRSPNSKADPTKTNYIGLRAENTMLSTDKEGTRIRDVTDGTSNTIMFVEADDDHAVIWTKPDDLEFDADAPHEGLVSPSVSNAFIAGLTDGSVRVISAAIDAKLLVRLALRNDNEPVSAF